ncbi:MAG: AAA family ATPase [Rhodocyclaceae bacterium]|nr:AAA family ATPase [Rhodocyclaceae bacterium]MDZ4215035.1 AAA family ATPase [Rhodocyclaceae bacterium]
MYLAHFGLTQLPFGITPDTEFIYPSRSHLEGINLLHFTLASGEGFVKVVGEIGTGKTLLCRNFLAELGPEWKAAYLPNPQMEPRAFLREVADDLGTADGAPEAAHVVKRLNTRLLELARTGKKVVLCIDEAQTMPRLTLESLRLLSNLETEKRKLLHIVLFGQPELDEMLAVHSARQLRQRIAFHHQLKHLDSDEVNNYVEQRLRIAGHSGDPIFEPVAVKLLTKAAGGTPRLINILSHKAMLLAFGEGQLHILPHHIKSAAQDTEGAVSKLGWWPW